MNGRIRRSSERTLWALVAAVATMATPAPAQEDAAAHAPRLEALQRHVATLASPAYAGRSGPGARKAEAYVTDALRGLGLKPLFDGSFTQDIPGDEPGTYIGRNVGAYLPGADPALRDQWVIVSAHYDHLGVKDGVVYPGADDNASGVAMLLEVARGLADAPEPPRRGVLFVSFDLEEAGLLGSRHFVSKPPVPLEQIRLFLTADLIGGALGGVCREQVFVIGAEHAAALRPWLRDASAGLPLKVADVGSDLLVINRSDYGPFRSRKIPYLFFSTGENPRYHTPRDLPESVDYPKLQAISRLIAGVVQRAAQAPELPTWSDTPAHTLDEAIALRDVLQTLLEHREALRIRGVQETLVSGTLEQLRQIVARGVQTPEERARILRSAQIILMTVL